MADTTRKESTLNGDGYCTVDRTLIVYEIWLIPEALV